MLVEAETPLWMVDEDTLIGVVQLVPDDLVNPLVAREATLALYKRLHLRVVHHVNMQHLFLMPTGWVRKSASWEDMDSKEQRLGG